MKNNPNVEKSFTLAKERYAAIGVDVDRVLKNLAKVPVSLHCWQGDDVGGFENFGGALTGGIMATGNYPGKARTPQELRADADEGAVAHPRQAPLQSARLLRRVRRQEGRPQRNRAGAFQELDRLGQVASASAWISIPPASRIPKAADGFTLSPAGQGHPAILDRARPGLPRRSARPWARRSARPASPTSGFPTA